MSFLKNILKPFVDFKEEDPNAPRENKPPRVEKTTRKSDEETGDTSISTMAPGKNDTDMSTAADAGTSATPNQHKTYFEDLIEEANAKNPLFQGTDFKEFIDSKIDVEAITDEATRYKTAFNVLKRTGLTKERLVTTGQQYLQLIDNDLKGFEDAYQQHYKTDVEQKEQLLQKKAEELQALSEKIAALNEEMKQMSQEIIKAKDKLNSNKTSFLKAGQNKKNEIQAELQKIDQYFN